VARTRLRRAEARTELRSSAGPGGGRGAAGEVPARRRAALFRDRVGVRVSAECL
jgi:hypothetical protein